MKLYPRLLLLGFIIIAAATPFIYAAPIEVHKGVIFHSVINGGNITFGWDFNCSNIVWSNNQVRFYDFDNGDTTWDRIGFRAPAGTTLNVTEVFDANMSMAVTVPGAGTDFEAYVYTKGEPNTVNGAAADSYAGGTLYYTMNAGGTVTLLWTTTGETYTIALDCVYSEVDVDMNHLLIANCTDSLGATHNESVRFTVDNAKFTFNAYMNRYEATVKRHTPQTVTFDTLDSFTDLDSSGSTASIVETTTATWVSGTMTRLQNAIDGGDWIGMILGEYVASLGTMFFYTMLVTIISIGTYNIGGVYVAIFSWILGWSVFSSLVHGNAQIIGIFLIGLGGAVAVTKFYIDRRNT